MAIGVMIFVLPSCPDLKFLLLLLTGGFFDLAKR